MDQVSVPSSLHKNLKEVPEQMAVALQSFRAKSMSNKPRFMEGGFSFHEMFQSFIPAVLRAKEKVRGLLAGTRACEIFDFWCEMVEKSYLMKLLWLSVVVNCICPIVAFVLFAVISFITTFTGFLLLEGALLILGACAAVLWLGAVGIFYLLSVLILITLHILYIHAGEIAHKIEHSCFSPRTESTDDDMVVVDTDHEE